jgi:hypothetical protein
MTEPKPTNGAGGFPNPLILIVPVLLALGAAYFLFRPQPNPQTEIIGLETFPDQERGHKDGRLSFKQTPPVGGEHNPAWQNSGIYNTPIEPEKAVHTLEHGGVWITYQPGLSDADVELLKKQARGRGCTLVSPYFAGALDHPVVLVAWGYRLKLDKADDPRIAAFIKRFERGPQTPEPGASCANAIGTPDER